MDEHQGMELFDALHAGDPAGLRLLRQWPERASLPMREDRHCLLRAGVRSCSVGVVGACLSVGANPNACSDVGVDDKHMGLVQDATVLFDAVAAGSASQLSLLIAFGLDLHFERASGFGAAHKFAWYCSMFGTDARWAGVLRLLAWGGVRLEGIDDETGLTPLGTALSRHDARATRLLLAIGCSTSAVNRFGESAEAFVRRNLDARVRDVQLEALASGPDRGLLVPRSIDWLSFSDRPK
jgi:hypothetical protein